MTKRGGGPVGHPKQPVSITRIHGGRAPAPGSDSLSPGPLDPPDTMTDEHAREFWATHVPDLIDRLEDGDDLVVRAAKAGLKSLTSQDFGPKANASADERKAAVAAWKAWWARQKP